MKALTVMQPWATFIAIGLKTIETRAWSTSHRGWLLIHASQTVSRESRKLYAKIIEILGPHPDMPSFEKLPRGAVLCQVDLQSICPAAAMLKTRKTTVLERELGNFRKGHYAWSLAVVKKFNPPLLAKGRPGLWEFQDGKSKLVRSPRRSSPGKNSPNGVLHKR